MSTNPTRDAIALVVVDYFDEVLFLTDKEEARTSRDLVNDLERAVAEATTAVCEGWWHPNVKRGIVHDHKPNQPMTMHRECEQVYTHRIPYAASPREQTRGR